MTNINRYKNEQREKEKLYRRSLDKAKKALWDKEIAKNFLSTELYKNADIVFCYVSSDIEVDTIKIISQAFCDKKIVAVPRCIFGTREMEFIEITSFDELYTGNYHIQEPKPELTKKAVATKNSVCVVPALLYDKSGYRLGYGGGYYDRFLENFCGQTVGLIYAECIRESLLHGCYDIPISSIICEESVKRIKI